MIPEMHTAMAPNAAHALKRAQGKRWKQAGGDRVTHRTGTIYLWAKGVGKGIRRWPGVCGPGEVVMEGNEDLTG